MPAPESILCGCDIFLLSIVQIRTLCFEIFPYNSNSSAAMDSYDIYDFRLEKVRHPQRLDRVEGDARTVMSEVVCEVF
jgi:hypothetical protein